MLIPALGVMHINLDGIIADTATILNVSSFNDTNHITRIFIHKVNLLLDEAGHYYTSSDMIE